MLLDLVFMMLRCLTFSTSCYAARPSLPHFMPLNVLHVISCDAVWSCLYDATLLDLLYFMLTALDLLYLMLCCLLLHIIRWCLVVLSRLHDATPLEFLLTSCLSALPMNVVSMNFEHLNYVWKLHVTCFLRVASAMLIFFATLVSSFWFQTQWRRRVETHKIADPAGELTAKHATHFHQKETTSQQIPTV